MGAGDRVEEIARWHLRAGARQSSHVGLSLGSTSYPEALSELLLLSTPIHWSNQSVGKYLVGTYHRPGTELGTVGNR